MRHLLCGGARPPRVLIGRYRRDLGIPLVQVWGMTETSPLASLAWPKERMRDWDDRRITDAARTPAARSAAGSRTTTTNQTAAGCAHQSGGNVYTSGSNQAMGPWNTFTTHTLEETSDGYYVIADSGCPA